ncbi:MAG: hypothetical protein ACFFAU_01485 [Candidatus Hodarchaeota archaeon]
MDKSEITIKLLERTDENTLKVIATIKNSGDEIWNLNEYTFRAHFISYNGTYYNDVYCSNAWLTEVVNPEESIEKIIYIHKPGAIIKPEFWHPENVVMLDMNKEGVYWLRNEVSFKIKDIADRIKIMEHTTSEISTGEELQLELDLILSKIDSLVDMKYLSIEPQELFGATYGDNFETLDNWTTLEGNFEIENDSVKTIDSGGGSHLLNDDLENVSNNVLIVSGKFENSSEKGYFGIVFSYQDESNYWQVIAGYHSISGEYRCYLQQKKNGISSNIKYTSISTMSSNTWYELKINWLNDNDIDIYIDSLLVMSHSSNEIVSGKVGLASYKYTSPNIYLDDFILGEGSYNCYLYKKFSDDPVKSELNKISLIRLSLDEILEVENNKLRLKVFNNGSNNIFKIKAIYNKVK